MVMHVPRSPAFSPCLREIVRRLHASLLACRPAFSVTYSSPCYSFHVSRIWPHVNLPFSVQPGLAVLPSRAVSLTSQSTRGLYHSFECLSEELGIVSYLVIAVFFSSNDHDLWEMMMPLRALLWPQYLVGLQWQLADRRDEDRGKSVEVEWVDIDTPVVVNLLQTCVGLDQA